jgi:hypothetical protein
MSFVVLADGSGYVDTGADMMDEEDCENKSGRRGEKKKGDCIAWLGENDGDCSGEDEDEEGRLGQLLHGHEETP